MAIKKIDSFNKHQNPSTNQNPFDIENYLNVNWNKAQEVINNNADELKTAQDNISEIKQEQITQNTDIENIKKSNEEKAKEIASLKIELENEKSKFENYAIHGKSTGEYIHLTDSSETDCRVDVRGNSKQVVTEISPSLEHPSKIETVGSNKNVFNDEKVKGLIVTTESMKNTELMDISLANNKYYIARIWFEDGTYATGNNFMLYGYNSSNQNIASIPNGQAKIHTNATEIAKIRIVTNITGIETYENKKIKGIKIEETDENGIATSYSSFGQGSVKVTSCNKNLLDMEKDVFIEKYGLTVKTDKNNELTLNGKSTNATFIKLYGEEMVVHTNVAGWKTKKIKKGTYTLSISKTGETSDNNINLLVRQGKDTTESNTITQIAQIGSKTTASSKFEIKEDTEIAIWLWLNTNNTLNDFKLKVQLERGDKATEVIENKEDSAVLTVQEEMLEGDYFDKVNKKEVHSWKKRIWNETEKWTLDAQNTNDEYISFRTQIEDMVSLNSQNTQLVTDKIINEYGGITLNKEHLWVYGINVVVCIKKERLESLDDLGFKKYLTQNNVIVYYKLAEPKKLDLTQEQIQALEKLDKLKTYKNITNITTDSIAILNADYKKDLETLINQVNQALVEGS